MVPPVRFVLKVTPVVGEFAHKVSLDIAFTCADGFTVIVNVLLGPEQLTEPFVKVGVTTIVAVTGDVPAFVAVKAGIVGVLVPLAAKPIDGVSFVHEYDVVPPVFVVENVTKVVDVLLHFTWSAG